MSKARFALLSDLHVHSWPEHNPVLRLEECVSVIDEVREWCVSNDVNTMVFAGDMFQMRGVLHTTAYTKVAEALKRVKSAGIEFVACAGNHDQEDKAGTVDALQPLAAGGLLQLPSHRGWMRYCSRDADYELILFNYCDSESILADRIADACRTPPDFPAIGIFHHGFVGARVGSALEYVVKEPISAKKLKLDGQFDAVFAGHYHEHQRIEGTKHGWYIGSPLEHTRSDYDVEEHAKGFLDVTISKKGKVRFKQVAIKRPRFVRVMALARGCEEITREEIEGNFVDLVYDSDGVMEEMYSTCRSWNARGIKAIPLPAAKAKEHAQRLDVDPSMSPKRVLKRYMKYERKNIKAAKLNREKLLDVGLDLLHEVTE